MEKKYQAAALGLAIGDAVGAPFETMTAEAIEVLTKADPRLQNGIIPIGYARTADKHSKELVGYPAGFYTDDTAQFICLGRSLVENGFDTADQFKRYQDWLFDDYAVPAGFKSMGSGGHTRRTLASDYRDPADLNGTEVEPNSTGSLMRSLAVSLAYQGDYESLKEKSLLAAYNTHNNLESGWCCVVYSAMVSLVLDGETEVPAMSRKIKDLYPDMPDSVQAVLDTDFSDPTGESVVSPSFAAVDALKNGIWAFHQALDYASAIDRVIRIGGDTDTYGVVAGSLIGARDGLDGLPEDWLNQLCDSFEINDLATQLYLFNKSL